MRLGLSGLQAIRVQSAGSTPPTATRSARPIPGRIRSSGRRRSAATPGDDTELLDSPLTPPAIVNGKLFFGSVTGEIHCLSASRRRALERPHRRARHLPARRGRRARLRRDRLGQPDLLRDRRPERRRLAHVGGRRIPQRPARLMPIRAARSAPRTSTPETHGLHFAVPNQSIEGCVLRR